MIATPLIISESSAKVCCFIYPVSFLSWETAKAYCRYLILWIRHTRRVIPTCHTNIQSLVKLIKITVNGFFFFTSVARIQNCMSCTSTARERNNLTPCMGWIHETVTATSCRFCRHSGLGAAAHTIQIKTQYFVVFSAYFHTQAFWANGLKGNQSNWGVVGGHCSAYSNRIMLLAHPQFILQH